MRVVLDTNVLAGGIAGAHIDHPTAPAQVWLRWKAGAFDLIISSHIEEELRRVLDLPWFSVRLSNANRRLAIAELAAFAERVYETAFVSGIASHWQDDLVLAAAVSGNADYLVTGDAKFRRVDEYEGVKLRTPAEFLAELDALAS
jgi:predicted nucleic acid-binding protein